MKRTVIKIDEELCNGCGICVNGCHEGALQIIDRKARLISDLYCDGLGACIGECPLGAIEFEEREAVPYSEVAVMERIVPKGEKTISAHLNHLKDHGEMELYRQGIEYLKKHNININIDMIQEPKKPSLSPEPIACGCPGTMAQSFKPVHIASPEATEIAHNTSQRSELTQFPVQLHLLNPNAGFIQGSDLLLAADCTAFASGELHSRFLKGKSLAIACPKLDSQTEIYVDKLVMMIDQAKINTLTVLIMEVPCCNGLLGIALKAREEATRNIPIKSIILTVRGEVKSEEWI